MTDPNKIALGLGLGTGNDANAVAFAALSNLSFCERPDALRITTPILLVTLGATVSQTTIQNTALSASVTHFRRSVTLSLRSI